MKSTALFLFALLAGCTNSQDSEEAESGAETISATCLEETQSLTADSALNIAQSIIFEDYASSVRDICDFNLADLGCSVEFEGDTRTFDALCAAQGGQVYLRPVIFSCLLGAIEYELGTIPTCVGGSCNVTNVQPGDVATPEVSEFLDSLSIIGCDADSAASSITPAGLFQSVLGMSLVLIASTVSF